MLAEFLLIWDIEICGYNGMPTINTTRAIFIRVYYWARDILFSEQWISFKFLALMRLWIRLHHSKAVGNTSNNSPVRKVTNVITSHMTNRHVNMSLTLIACKWRLSTRLKSCWQFDIAYPNPNPLPTKSGHTRPTTQFTFMHLDY